jgi:flagellar biogenesis protein FliO
MTTIAAFLPIIFFLGPVVFVIWFLVKFLKIQQEKNQILRAIADKLDKQNN